jgi:hypothetical protein
VATVADTPLSHASVEAAQRRQWDEFYRVLHERPVLQTYRELFAPDVEVRDPAGHWSGVNAWSAEEREAITFRVRARIMDVLAGSNITMLKVDFCNPAESPGHCPHRRPSYIALVTGARTSQGSTTPAEHSRSGETGPARPVGPKLRSGMGC